MAVHIGQAEVAALVLVGELLMINTELVEQRGVEVVHVHGILDDVVAVVIGLAVSNSPFEAAAGYPGGETQGVVITAEALRVVVALAVVGAAKLTRPKR